MNNSKQDFSEEPRAKSKSFSRSDSLGCNKLQVSRQSSAVLPSGADSTRRSQARTHGVLWITGRVVRIDFRHRLRSWNGTEIADKLIRWLLHVLRAHFLCSSCCQYAGGPFRHSILFLLHFLSHPAVTVAGSPAGNCCGALAQSLHFPAGAVPTHSSVRQDAADSGTDERPSSKVKMQYGRRAEDARVDNRSRDDPISPADLETEPSFRRSRLSTVSAC